MGDSTKGASNNERLLAAARSDQEGEIEAIFEQGNFNINYQDGMGNTALHYAASYGSADVLDLLLSYEGCDVDIINLVEGATPLHLAVQNNEPEIRSYIVESLLDAGALMTIKNKYGDFARDLVPVDDEETINLFERQELQNNISHDDVADDDDDDDDDEEYSEDDD